MIANPALAMAALLESAGYPGFTPRPSTWVDILPDNSRVSEPLVVLNDLPGLGGAAAFAGLADGIHSELQVQVRGPRADISGTRILIDWVWRFVAHQTGVIVPASQIAAIAPKYAGQLADVELLAVEAPRRPVIADRDYVDRPVFTFTANVWTSTPDPCS